jgi:cytochrome o ubiquinol oxidase subunit 3
MSHEGSNEIYEKTLFGFWVYLLTDFVMFGALFSTYAVLHYKLFGVVSDQGLWDLPFTLLQTLLLLSAAFTSGLAGTAAHRRKPKETLFLFGLTFVLGAVFLGMQLFELHRWVEGGDSWNKSGFLSAFFTLIGTHAAHLFFALLWTIFLTLPVWRHGISDVSLRRLTCLKMFWQFLNLVWVFIFSVVYLLR